jgi:O-acetyl-ADP-ribose deacetylase (regulator of RNase III)
MNTVLHEHTYSNQKKFQLVEGDITQEPVDAIVNAANSQLAHGGGVAWAISRAGGESIQRESDLWVQRHGEVSHAEPAYTSGGDMPCKYVIHAVGPVWGDGDEDRKLADAVTGSLRVTTDLGLASVTLPAISTGIFGFPKERAAKIIFTAIDSFLTQNTDSPLTTVRLILYGEAEANRYLAFWQNHAAKGDSMLKLDVEHNPTQEKLDELDVSSWSIWTKEVSEFPWFYDTREQFYVIEGRARITPEGADPVEVQAGDFVTCPEGMACTWQVLEPIRKYYHFG